MKGAFEAAAEPHVTSSGHDFSRANCGIYRRLAFRKGAAIAKVAVARKLAIRLYIMRRDRIDYAEICRRGSHAGMLGDVALV